MFYISDIIGKKVVSLYESNFVGTISNIYLNISKNKVELFEIINSSEEKLYFCPQNIYSIGDVVVVKTNTNLINKSELDFSTLGNNLINKEIYTPTGFYIGKVLDILLVNYKNIVSLNVKKHNTNVIEEFEMLKQTSNSDEFKVCKKLNNDTIISTHPIKNIVRFGDILIFQNTPQKIKFSNLRPQILIDKKIIPQKVYALQNTTDELSKQLYLQNSSTMATNGEITNEQTLGIIKNKHQPQSSSTRIPVPVLANSYNFLLGRKAVKNIFASNKEIIIRKNTRITEKHIEAANTYNKLREITIYSE